MKISLTILTYTFALQYMLFVYLELIYMILPFKIHVSVNTNVNYSVIFFFQKPGPSEILGSDTKQNNAKTRRHESRCTFHLSHNWAECSQVVTQKWEKKIT